MRVCLGHVGLAGLSQVVRGRSGRIKVRSEQGPAALAAPEGSTSGIPTGGRNGSRHTKMASLTRSHW